MWGEVAPAILALVIQKSGGHRSALPMPWKCGERKLAVLASGISWQGGTCVSLPVGDLRGRCGSRISGKTCAASPMGKVPELSLLSPCKHGKGKPDAECFKEPLTWEQSGRRHSLRTEEGAVGGVAKALGQLRPNQQAAKTFAGELHSHRFYNQKGRRLYDAAAETIQENKNVK